MRRLLAAFALSLIGACTAAADAERTILFIGNSFTFGYGSAAMFWRADTVTDLNGDGIGGVPALFEAFSAQAGLAWDVSLETRGGSDFAFHLAEKRAEITSRPWDVVVAHSYSTLDADAPGDPARFLTDGRALAGVLVENNPAVQFYVTATWSRPDLVHRPGSPWSGTGIAQMGRDVDAAYDALAAEVPGVKAVNPVGLAFERAVRAGIADGNPYDGIAADAIDLWTWDHYHGSAHGYYLEALVVFGNVTGVDPLALGEGECAAFELGFSREQARALQQVAHDELVAAGVTLRTPEGMTARPWGTPCS